MFHDEEALQLQFHYPGYESHKQLHEDFKAAVGKMAEEFAQNASPEELSSNVNKVVVRWLVNHIIREDKKIGEHISRTSSQQNP
ncbi:MAG: hypothetical protein LBV07_03870 [Syntrophobacterales bacterium]|nr:hypothetical protein [Syntrophobacterales bacterium]